MISVYRSSETSLGEKRMLRAARGSGITAPRQDACERGFLSEFPAARARASYWFDKPQGYAPGLKKQELRSKAPRKGEGAFAEAPAWPPAAHTKAGHWDPGDCPGARTLFHVVTQRRGCVAGAPEGLTTNNVRQRAPLSR